MPVTQGLTRQAGNALFEPCYYPIGLAGGLNLYGFAGGDPVNFSDPFGLCPREPKTMADALVCIGQLVRPAEKPIGIASMIVTAPLGGDMGMMDVMEGAVPIVAIKWGRNRLVKELHDAGFVLDRPTKSGGGLLYRNETGEEIRIMPRPAQRFRNDPAAKHEAEFRYRTGPDQPWGPHTSIPDR